MYGTSKTGVLSAISAVPHHIYIGELPQHLDEIPKNEPIVVCCDAGYKGSLAASILALHQYHNLTNVLGGMTAWKRAGFQTEK